VKAQVQGIRRRLLLLRLAAAHEQGTAHLLSITAVMRFPLTRLRRGCSGEEHHPLTITITIIQLCSREAIINTPTTIHTRLTCFRLRTHSSCLKG
jgi:hypothetical protein